MGASRHFLYRGAVGRRSHSGRRQEGFTRNRLYRRQRVCRHSRARDPSKQVTCLCRKARDGLHRIDSDRRVCCGSIGTPTGRPGGPRRGCGFHETGPGRNRLDGPSTKWTHFPGQTDRSICPCPVEDARGNGSPILEMRCKCAHPNQAELASMWRSGSRPGTRRNDTFWHLESTTTTGVDQICTQGVRGSNPLVSPRA